ncbi:MAG: T9SS type A sorting domain-containing protein [Vicingus serpentipes]|nr:T9SS type A sorting domain-containing protein [Vicingus serpentipes]
MRLLLLSICIFLFQSIFAQKKVSFSKQNISVQKSTVVSPKTIEESFNANIVNKEAPTPDGNSVKSYVLQQKIKSRKLFPYRKASSNNKKGASAAQPSVGKEFALKRYVLGNVYDLYGGTPNDNTLAVSNAGNALVGVNSFIFAYDLLGDSNLYPGPASKISLASFTNSSDVFDPKIIYDKEADRFILVFLKNRAPGDNMVVVCFSTTNNPVDPWNAYELPGNPLNNNRWTDFPAIAMTETDLFITGNLIIPNVSWQVGFDGSIIWQIEKAKGYNGDPTLNTVLFNDVKYGGNFVRNLHPIQGADGAADEMYLLSNRNFDLTNDSIFIASVVGKSTDATQSLTVDVYQSNLNYGMPPNGRQQDTDTTDPTGGLQTNDARVLGAIKIGDNVQFVSNSINPATGLAAIYHGTIADIATAPSITATLIADTTKDFGYPNIAWTGNEDCDIETIIAFDYSSLTDFPGTAAVYYDNDGNYSDYKIVKAGEDYSDALTGTYERWGDYFGLQRNYAQPGSTYSFGCFGKNKKFTGWCAELISPDTNMITATVFKEQDATSCQQKITVTAAGGEAPYTYTWDYDVSNDSNSTTGVCFGVSRTLTITDSRGCTYVVTVVGAYPTAIKTHSNNVNTLAYPNPFTDELSVEFYLDKDQRINAVIYDVTGRKVADILQQSARKGLNELNFSLAPLKSGNYILKIEGEGVEIMNKKIVKE